METNLSINGKIMAILSKEYEGQKTTYMQFLMDSEAKGMEILKVKITNEDDILKLKKGLIVTVPVNITAMNGNIYYSQISDIEVLKENKKS